MSGPWEDFKTAKNDLSSNPWDDFSSDSKAAPDPKHSKTETALFHGLQGATGNFLDELSGAGEAAGRAIGVKGIGGKFSDVGLSDDGPTLDWETLRDAYRQARDKKRALLKEQESEHPGAALGGNLAGAVVSPINKLTKGLSLTKGGALLGGVNALGGSEAESVGGMAVDTAIGTGLGAALGKGVEKATPLIEKGVSKVSQGARGLAEKFAAKALGAERGTIKKLGMDKVQAAGAQALDEGVLSPLASTDDLISRNEAIKSKGGKMMEEAYGAIDDAGESTFNPQTAAGEVEHQLGGFWRSPLNKGETNQFENTLEAILMRGEKNIPLREAQALKQELGKVANWKNNLNISDKERMARDAYGIVSRQIDEAVETGAGAIDKAGLTGVLKKGKDLYSKASTSEQLLTNKQAAQQGNNFFGLTDTIAGAGAAGYGATTGDWEGAGAAMLAKKGLQKYGAQNAALGLNKISKMLMKTPKFAELAQRNPKAFGALVSEMATRAKSGAAMPKSAQQEFDPMEHQSEEDAREAFVEGN